MNKMKKLLSVLLAVVMILSSMTILSSAAVTNYQSVDELEALDAYSPYGTVTRLSTSERMSIVYDWLDLTLAKANINIGDPVIDALGITIVLNLTSVNNLARSLDSVRNSLKGTAWGLASGILDLGILESLNMDTWDTGFTREGSDSMVLVKELAELLGNNGTLIDSVFSDGIRLGTISSFIKGIDLSGINQIVTDLPSFVKGIIFPLFERWDHTTDEITALENALSGDGNVVGILDYIINDFFDHPQSITTVKADANGNIISDHTLPSSGTRQIYVKDGNTITVSHYYTQSDVDKNDLDNIIAVGYMETGKYVLAPEYEGVEDTEYVFQYTDEFGNVQNLKYYEKDSYWLPSYVANKESFNIASETGANLLYEMIPYVFDEMVPVVANGSLKKLLAGLFGTQFTYVGEVGSDEVKALADSSNTFFTQKQGEYLWEWSDYAVINGTHYYRFEDQIFVGDTSNANEYMNIINWDYEITSALLTKYIPADTSSKSAAGYSKILHGVNDFLIDVATEIANLDVLNVSFTKGDNTNLVANIKAAAQAVLKYHPEHIFGSSYEDEDSYYNLIVGNDNDMVLTGIAALVIDALAPQMILPGATELEEQGVKVGGLLAAMLRELATQLLPHYDYDALIYSDYNTRTFVSGKDNSYWLDVIMTMAVDIGMKYLHNLADMNEDTQAWANLGYDESMTAEKTYAADSFDATGWEDKVDYIIDWALTTTSDGSILTWSMSTLVGKYVTDAGLTISLTTNEDPWLKLDAILDNVLFLDQFTSETNLETGLRGTILDLVNLQWGNILGTESNPAILDVPSTSRLVTTNLLEALSLEIRDLINGLFKNVGGGSYYFIPESFTNLDQIANQENLATIIKNLLAALPTAYTNGLMTTVLPFINMFLGWSTDAQKYATPTITFSGEYIYAASDATTASTTINVTNNSSGMLLKHRANIKSDGSYVETEDQPYTLKVTGIECDIAGTTFDKEELSVAPYGSGSITATIPYSGTDTVARFTITYTFSGKDGKVLAGEMKVIAYQLITSTSFTNTSGLRDGDDDTGYTGISDYNIYQFTNDIYATVTGQTVTVNNTSSITGNKDRIRFGSAVPEGWSSAPTDGKCVTGQAAKYFRQIYSVSGFPDEIKNAGWDQYFGGNDYPNNTSTSGRIYLALDGVTADTEFPLGIYDMGELGLKFIPQDKDCDGNYTDGSGDTKVIEYDYYYYDDFGIDAVMNDYVGHQLRAVNFSDAAQDEFAAYEASLKNVVKLATYPLTLEYNDKIGTQIEDAMDDLKEKYDALMAAEEGASSSAVEATNISALEAELAKDDGDGEVEINFQDYDLFEYFEYQDYRTANRNLVKTFYAPAVLDKYYVEGSGVSYEELSTSIIPGATETVAAAITASLSERSDEEVNASQKAHDEFVAPVHPALYISDQTSRLAYYRQFLLPIAADLTFVTREIGYADANYPVSAEALYTEASWAAYRDAYDYAASMTDANIPSDVFEAKYNLMVAMKNLLLKTESAIENGKTADLIANKAIADEILAMNLADITLTEEAIAAGYTVEKALGELIVAAGYYYTGEDGNTWQLYADSADEYIDNDRPDVSTNIARIDACNANLEDAIALFDVASEPNTIALKEDANVEAYIDTENNCGFTGIIYGIDTLGSVSEDGSLADNLTTTYGDDYLAITEVDGGETTGTIIEVLDEDGNAVETYVFVYFGDIDMDGMITSTDGFFTEYYEGNGEGIEELYQFIAGDVDGDGMITSTDGFYMEYFEGNGEGIPTQQEIAEMVSANYYEM